MSDAIETAAAPEAVAETPAADSGRPEAPEQSYAEMKATLGRAEAPVESAAATPDPAASPAEAAVVPDGEQPRGADGKFAAKVENAGATAPGAAPALTPEQEAAAAAPPALTRVELPQGHPLRERGRTHFEVRFDSPEAEAEFRSVLETPVRAREVETLRGTVREVQTRALQAEAAARAANEFNALVFSDPRIVSTFQAIGEEHGPQAAQQWLDGLLQQQGQNLQQYVTEAQEAQAARQHAETSQQVVSSLLTERESLYPHWAEGDMRDAIAAYGSYLDVKGINEFDPADFRAFADARYIQHPAVRAQVEAWSREQQEGTERRINEQNAERERAALEKARLARETNPMGTVPAGLSTGRVTPAAEPEAGGSYLDHKRALAAR